MIKPLVSIIIPTKNSAATLDACLSSISKQTYKNIELIIVDNNSIDQTQEIAKQYTKHVYTKGPERSPQRNYGVKKSSGEYVLIIDSDMELDEKVVAESVSVFQSDLKIVGIVIPEESFGIGFWAQCKKLERSFYVGVPWMEAARVFRKDIYLKIGGYDETLVSGEDWDLSQRVEDQGTIGRINFLIYHNEGVLSLTATLKKKYYYAKQIKKYKNKEHSNLSNQVNILKRYKLYFTKPSIILFNPFTFFGMLFMKTLEFACGAAGLAIGSKNETI